MEQQNPTKQQVRRIDVVSNEELDDQIWPVNLAIIILAGFVTGLVLATSRFDEPVLIHNAYFRLGTIALTLIVWFAGVRLIHGRRMRRRLKICVLFSLLVHLWLLMGLGIGYYELVMDNEDSGRRLLEEVDRIVVPDYDPRRFENPDAKQDFERPVETEAPKATEPEPPKQRDVERPTPPTKRPEVEPEMLPQEQPDPTEMERREIPAPRRDDAAAGAQISRQEIKVRPEPDRPIPQPQLKPTPQEPPKMVAKVQDVQRKQTETPRQQRREFQEQPLSKTYRTTPQMARQAQRNEQQPQQAATPLATRRMIRPADVPQTEAQAPQPATRSEQPQTAPMQPQSVAVQQQREAPTASKQSVDPTPQVAQRVVQAPTQQRQTEWRPEIAQTPDRVPIRQPRQADLATTAAEPEPQAAPAVTRASDQPQPSTQSQVARQRPTQAPAGASQMPAEVPGPMASTSIAQNAPRKLDRPSSPSMEPSPGPPNQLARQASTAPRLTPMMVQEPTVAEAAVGSGSQPEPQDSPASQQRTEVAGLPGQRPSQAAAGSISSLTGQGSPLPLAAARRAMASLEGTEGVNMAPTTAPSLHRTRPGTELSSAAEPIENASTAGAGGAATNSAGSIALSEGGSNTAVTRSAAGAPAGNAGAAIGAAPMSRTPGPIGVAAGIPRAGGGGAPALAMGGQRPQLGRTPSAAAGLAGLGGRVAESMPGTEAGGPSQKTGPAQPGPNAAATSIVRGGGGLPSGAESGQPGGQPGQVAVGPGGLASTGEIGAASLQRATGGDTMAGPVVEGGISGPSRRMGRIPLADLAGDVPEMAGTAPTDGGTQTAGPSGDLEAGTPGVTRQMTGLPGKLVARVEVEGATKAGPAATTPGTAIGPRRLAEGGEEGPLMAAEVGAAPLGKTNNPGLPSGMAELIGDVPGPTTGASGEPAQLVALIGAEGTGDVGRSGGGLPVRIAALPGPGGLSYDPSPAVGLPSRRARPESEVVHTIARRFVIGRAGGELAIDGHAEELPAEAFRHRDPGKRADEAKKRGATAGSERAVEMGLEFLARSQFPDGHWAIDDFPSRVEAWAGEADGSPDPEQLVPIARQLLADEQGNARERQRLEQIVARHRAGRKLTKNELDDLAYLVRRTTLCPGEMQSDSAATSLALLAFLGAGYTHHDGKHQQTVARAVDWLVAHQRPDGDLFSNAGGSKFTWLYSHGIGAIALCEVYGMTRDERLKEPAQKAINFVVAAQNPELGGWRYRPREESDTSVSGWQLMALKSAQMAGLEVPEPALRKVENWLERAQASGNDVRYVYNPYADDTAEQKGGRDPSRSMTAEAMLMRIYLGGKRGDSRLAGGADYLLANLPDVGTAEQPTRDAYYWYYATQVMYQVQGPHWKAWNGRLRPLLETSQTQKGPLTGSWHPTLPVEDRWGTAAGRHYVTAMNLLMLEVYYRYPHLPLYKTLQEKK